MTENMFWTLSKSVECGHPHKKKLFISSSQQPSGVDNIIIPFSPMRKLRLWEVSVLGKGHTE